VNLLELTLPTPAENLACDEALLDWCDTGDGPEVLRFWEPQQHFVVVGFSNRVEREANVAACRESGIPILRRCSGGGTVLQGPGCLNYSLTLRIDSDPAFQTVTGTNRFVMERHRAALEKLLSGTRSFNFQPSTFNSQLAVRGHTDLVLGDRKFSGNAQRRKRHAVLFHGSFLLDFDLALMEKALRLPSKQPDYRAGRSHTEFLMNLSASASEVEAALKQVWGAKDAWEGMSSEVISDLAVRKYATDAWNFRL
jgi:lipoate-protein ligase A